MTGVKNTLVVSIVTYFGSNKTKYPFNLKETILQSINFEWPVEHNNDF